MSGGQTVAIVHLGSAGATGSRHRVASLRAIFEAAGAEVVEVPLLVDHRVGPGDVSGQALGQVVRAETVPEVLAWSRRAAQTRLAEIDPSVVVSVTARAFRPDLAPASATVVLDFVDRMSDSYRDRAGIVGWAPRGPLFRVLSATSGRFERRPLPASVLGIAAGWTDARTLGLTWVPITMAVEEPMAATAATHDVLFLGKLSYPPNIEAAERLARLWPEVLRRRPATTLLLAGASPTPAVEALAQRCGWTLQADFADLGAVVASTRLAISPLEHASGIQTKVLSSAAYGLAQLVTPAVIGGFAPGFPARVADDDRTLVSALVELLDDDGELQRLGEQAQQVMAATYTAEAWGSWASSVLERSPGPGAA
jgi:hypothetical protein